MTTTETQLVSQWVGDADSREPSHDLHMAGRIFGELFKLCAPVVRWYTSDLFWDARWLMENIDDVKSGDWFYYHVGDCGTHLFRDAEYTYGSLHYRFWLNVNSRQEYILTIVQIGETK